MGYNISGHSCDRYRLYCLFQSHGKRFSHGCKSGIFHKTHINSFCHMDRKRHSSGLESFSCPRTYSCRIILRTEKEINCLDFSDIFKNKIKKHPILSGALLLTVSYFLFFIWLFLSLWLKTGAFAGTNTAFHIL